MAYQPEDLRHGFHIVEEPLVMDVPCVGCGSYEWDYEGLGQFRCLCCNAVVTIKPPQRSEP